MVLRPEQLPHDPDLLIEMLLASEGEKDELRATVATLKSMIFGARSEKSVVIVAEQLPLGLADIDPTVAIAQPANDDGPKSFCGS